MLVEQRYSRFCRPMQTPRLSKVSGQGFNATCRYKIRYRVDTNSAISYIMSGLMGPDADWTDNFAKANRVGIPVAGSYALGLVDAISEAKDQEAFFYSWVDAVNRQCG